jgi:hypothetical protein
MKNIEKKRSLAFGEAVVRAINFFKKLALTLQVLIQDYNLEKILIQNPDATLSFQTTDAGGKKKFENVTIINSILYTFSFAAAIQYYLESGKLAGRGLYFTDEEKKDLTGEK